MIVELSLRQGRSGSAGSSSPITINLTTIQCVFPRTAEAAGETNPGCYIELTGGRQYLVHESYTDVINMWRPWSLLQDPRV